MTGVYWEMPCYPRESTDVFDNPSLNVVRLEIILAQLRGQCERHGYPFKGELLMHTTAPDPTDDYYVGVTAVLEITNA